MNSAPSQSPLEERRLENEIRPMRYIKAKLPNYWRMDDYRTRWDGVKYRAWQKNHFGKGQR